MLTVSCCRLSWNVCGLVNCRFNFPQRKKALKKLCHEIEIESGCDIDEFSLIFIAQHVGAQLRLDLIIVSLLGSHVP